MMYVLDTCVLSELRKVRLGKADANVTAWTDSVDAADLFVSAITIMELELGVLSIERDKVMTILLSVAEGGAVPLRTKRAAARFAAA